MTAPQVHLAFDSEPFEQSHAGCPLDAQQIEACCRQALNAQFLLDFTAVDTIEISVQLLDSKAMRALNLQYRGKDLPTNVLSFESDMPLLCDKNTGSLHVLGDLVLCPEVIAGEADQQGKRCEQHWVHMLVHGTLHLCGYDHVDPDEAGVMENLEVQILSLLDHPDPYQIQPLR